MRYEIGGLDNEVVRMRLIMEAGSPHLYANDELLLWFDKEGLNLMTDIPCDLGMRLEKNGSLSNCD